MLTRLKSAAVPLAVLAVGIGIFVLLNATKPTPDAATELPRALSVYVETASERDAQLRIQANGEVRARIRSDIVPQVNGRIIEVSPEFVEGGAFAANETLFVIEDTDYQSALNEAQARVASAQVDLEQALADADVARKQLAGQANPSPLALKKPQVAHAEAGLEAALASLSLAKTNLARTRVSLPYAGRIAMTTVDLGQFVSAGKVVGSAFSTDSVEVRLPLTDAQLGALGVPIGYRFEEGQGLPVDFSAEVAGKVYRWSGELTRMDALIDPATRVIYATAEVKDPYKNLTSRDAMPLAVGLYVNASIAGRIVDDAIEIPGEGLRAGNRVFVLTEEGQLSIRNVNVIHNTADQTLLSSGVSQGENVIVSAIRNPIAGMRLESIDSKPGSQEGNQEDYQEDYQESGAIDALAD